MPIEYTIDHARRLVVTRGSGVFSDADVFGYQREVWSRPDVAGYDELIDMTAVQTIAVVHPTANRVQQLAAESARMDAPAKPSKFAIVAPDELAFGLGRMYQTYRELEQSSTKVVRVFHTLSEAMCFLGIKSLD